MPRAAQYLGPLRYLTDLKQLRIMHTPVSDIEPLARLHKLRQLDLRGTRVTKITPLAPLSGLEILDIEGLQVPDDEIEKLQRALPNLFIRR